MVDTICVCVDGIYIKDGKMLLLKRNVEPFKDYWHVAGGHADEDETLKETLKREFKEETCLDVEVGNIIDGRIEETADRKKLIVAYKIESAKGNIRLNHENKEYGWFEKIPKNCVYDYFKVLSKKK